MSYVTVATVCYEKKTEGLDLGNFLDLLFFWSRHPLNNGKYYHIICFSP
jgi:hypothetical protein